MNIGTAGTAQSQRPTSVELIAAMLWDFRLELALLAAAAGAYVALFLRAHLSPPVAGVIVAAATVLLFSVGSVRRALARSLHAAVARRSWRMAWMHCGLSPVRAGKVTQVPAGERIEVRMSRGSSFEELGERAEQLACCLSLRELRVARSRTDLLSWLANGLRGRDPVTHLLARIVAGSLRHESACKPPLIH